MENKIQPADLIVGAQVMWGTIIFSVREVSEGGMIMLYEPKYLAEEAKEIDIRFLSPIPITPERLEEIGFSTKDNELWHKEDVTVTKDIGYWWAFIGVQSIGAKLSGIHHLQMLLQGLTGNFTKITK